MPGAAKKRWIRFSPKILLGLIIVLGIPLVWIGNEQRQSQIERQIAGRLRIEGIKEIQFGGPFDLRELSLDKKPQGWWRDITRQAFGERVVEIEKRDAPCDFKDLTPVAKLATLQGLDLGLTQVGDLTPIAGLTNLEYLGLFATRVSDLTPLSRLTALQWIDISETTVSDLMPLSGLTHLQGLLLSGTPVSDLSPLSGLTNLEFVYLSGTAVSDEQIAKLQRALPNCKISK